MAHSPYETCLQGIMVDVIIKMTTQSKIMNHCRRISFRELALA